MTGGRGFVGRHIIRELLARGMKVQVLTRHAGGNFPPGVEVVLGDLSDVESLRRAASGCRRVIHAAGEIADESKMRETNVNGTAALLSALPDDLEHLVAISSIGVIGPSAGGLIREDAECRPATIYEQSKYEAERLVAEWRARTGVPVAILRPTTVFGEHERPRPKDSFREWLAAIQRGRFAFIGRGAVANYVYAGDVGNAAAVAVDALADGLFHIADPAPLDQFVGAAADALSVPRPRVRIPLPVALTMTGALQAAAPLVGRRSPLTLSRVRALSSRTTYSGERFAAAFDWRPPAGYSEGLKRTVAAYRAAGALR